MKTKKLKKRDALSFKDDKDEQSYLFKSVFGGKVVKEELKKTLTISELRHMYDEIIQGQELLEKYDASSIYWSVEQESAIVDYLEEKDRHKKDLIFARKLYIPIKRLVENIIFTYKLYRTDVTIVSLQDDCVSFLATKIERYNPETGAKAFSFLGTIAKHYLMGEKKTLHRNTKNNLDIADINMESSPNSELSYDMESDDDHETNHFVFNKVIDELEKELANEKTLPTDKKVIEAIIFIFRNRHMLDVYNRSLIYHLLKERTGLQTKEITYSLSRLKRFYKEFKQLLLREEG